MEEIIFNTMDIITNGINDMKISYAIECENYGRNITYIFYFNDNHSFSMELCNGIIIYKKYVKISNIFFMINECFNPKTFEYNGKYSLSMLFRENNIDQYNAFRDIYNYILYFIKNNRILPPGIIIDDNSSRWYDSYGGNGKCYNSLVLSNVNDFYQPMNIDDIRWKLQEYSDVYLIPRIYIKNKIAKLKFNTYKIEKLSHKVK